MNVQYRSITPQELAVISKIFSDKDLLLKSTEQLIEDMVALGSTGTLSTGMAAGGSAWVAAGSGAAGVGAIVGAAVVGGFVLATAAAVGGYYLYIKDIDQKAYLKRVEEEGTKAQDKIIDRCLKDEFNNFIKAHHNKIYIRNDLGQLILNENHELFNSWIQISNMSFLTCTLTERDKTTIKEYEEKIFKFIKNDRETVKNFHHYMRRYCAANKLGEFSKTLPKHGGAEWQAREKLKNQMISQCFRDPSKKNENGKSLEEIIHRFYATYKAITFLISASKSHASYPQVEINPEEIRKYEVALEKFIDDRIDPNTKDLFNRLFRTYRYLGGRCEFDPKNIFEMEEFDKYFSTKPFLEDYKEMPVLMGVTIALGAATNVMTCGIFLPLFTGASLYSRSVKDEINKMTVEEKEKYYQELDKVRRNR